MLTSAAAVSELLLVYRSDAALYHADLRCDEVSVVCAGAMQRVAGGDWRRDYSPTIA